MIKVPVPKAEQHIENYFEERARSGDATTVTLSPQNTRRFDAWSRAL